MTDPEARPAIAIAIAIAIADATATAVRCAGTWPSNSRRVVALVCSVATSAALVACGGHDAGSSVPSSALHAVDGGARAEAAGLPPGGSGAAAVTPPLLDDAGQPMPSDPRSRPADGAAWTVAGRYATAAQARELLAARADAMPVNVRCCGIEAVDEAVGIAFGMQASGAADDTPVLVAGDDLRLAAAVANRLTGGGMTRVWLVTP